MARNIQLANSSSINATSVIVISDDLDNTSTAARVTTVSHGGLALASMGVLTSTTSYIVLSTTTRVLLTNVNTGVTTSVTLPSTSTTLLGIKNSELVFGGIIAAVYTIYTISQTGVVTTRVQIAGGVTTVTSTMGHAFLVVQRAVGTTFDVIDLSTWTIAYTLTGLPASPPSMVLSDGRFRLAASATIFYTASGTNTAPAAVSPQTPNTPSAQIGNSTVYFGSSSVISVNLTTLVVTTELPSFQVSSPLTRSESALYGSISSVGQLYHIPSATLKQSLVPIAVLDIDEIPLAFKHTVVINETLSATEFDVKAFSRDGFNLVRQQTMTGTGGDLLLPDNDQYLITVFPKMGDVFQVTTAYTVGQRVFPKNTTQFPYYFTCTTAGTSGLVEPAWNTTVGGTTPTGSAIFTVVEQIPNVSAKFPILPEPV